MGAVPCGGGRERGWGRGPGFGAGILALRSLLHDWGLPGPPVHGALHCGPWVASSAQTRRG